MPISLIKVHPAVMTKRCLKDQVPFYLNDHGFAVKKKSPVLQTAIENSIIFLFQLRANPS